MGAAAMITENRRRCRSTRGMNRSHRRRRLPAHASSPALARRQVAATAAPSSQSSLNPPVSQPGSPSLPPAGRSPPQLPRWISVRGVRGCVRRGSCPTQPLANFVSRPQRSDNGGGRKEGSQMVIFPFPFPVSPSPSGAAAMLLSPRYRRN